LNQARPSTGVASSPRPSADLLSHVVFRLRHNCPLATLSREFPDVLFLSWSTHRQEIVQAVTPSKEVAGRIAGTFTERLPRCKTITFDGGVLAIHPILWPKRESISWQLETHHALWLQPLRCRDGWEYFDVVTPQPEPFQAYLRKLMTEFPLEIEYRGRVGGRELASSFFVPLNPVLGSLTPKQMEAILGALKLGYYRQPRATTTREIASSLHLSRSAFEERLRNAENTVIDGALAGIVRNEDARKRLPRKKSGSH
jgi:predicted DNA binding protein